MKIMEGDLTLRGDWITLSSLKDSDIEELVQLGRHADIWTHLPFNGADSEALRREMKASLLLKSTGEQYPFVIRENKKNLIIGSTRFFEIAPHHKKLEIGWTWLHPSYWGGGYNLEAKLLLLTYCFESLGLHRVQLKTRDSNIRSQKAILKLGAKYEGTLRKDRVMPDGKVRDTMMFSLIDEDWPEAKQNLQNLLTTTSLPNA